MRYDSSKYQHVDRTPPKPGNYPFYVIEAAEKVSKASGNDMIELKMEITIPDRQKPIVVYDYLVSSEKSLEKIKQFCEAVGLDFANDELTSSSCVRRAGFARFALGQPKQDGNRYLELKEYYPARNSQAASAAGHVDESQYTPTVNDDIPF